MAELPNMTCDLVKSVRETFSIKQEDLPPGVAMGTATVRRRTGADYRALTSLIDTLGDSEAKQEGQIDPALLSSFHHERKALGLSESEMLESIMTFYFDCKKLFSRR